MLFINDLVQLVEDRWRAKNYDEADFPAIAEQALRSMDALGQFKPQDMFDWAARQHSMPAQKLSSAFSDFQLQLHDGSRFELEMYYWIDGTTEIHSHTFGGAFRVLAGSSIQSRYLFEEQRRISAFCRLGALRLQESELLRTGEVRQVHPQKWAHALFHLDRPSVTLILKTKRDLEHDLSFVFLKPGIAVNVHAVNPEYLRRSHALSALRACPLEGYAFEDYVCGMLRTTDFLTGARLFQDAAMLTQDPALIGRMVGVMVERHGEAAAMLPAALEDAGRSRRIAQLRKTFQDPEHRFFLALAMNVPSWKWVVTHTAKRFPDRDPEQTALRWLREIASRAPALGLTADHLDALERWLKDGAVPQGDAARPLAEAKGNFMLKPLLSNP